MRDIQEIKDSDYITKREVGKLIGWEFDCRIKEIKKNTDLNINVLGIAFIFAGIGLILWLISWKSLFWCLLLLGLILCLVGAILGMVTTDSKS